MLHVFQSLTEFILNHATPCFLLHEVVKRLEGHKSEGIQVSISDYEFFLKHHSGLSLDRQKEVRQKIMGRKVPLETAQLLFPVAAGGRLEGSLVVTAHMSPDIDTVVSSFNGWMDAFEMDVSTGLHRWNVPNDPAQILEAQLLFLDRFGSKFFSILSDNRSSLTLTSLDLATTEGLRIHHLADRTLDVAQEGGKHASVVVDANGNFCDGWLPEDIEKVRLVTDSLNHCSRWIQNAFFQAMVSKQSDPFSLLEKRFEELEPVIEFSKKSKSYLNIYLSDVLGVAKGLQASISDFMCSMEQQHQFGFESFLNAFKAHKSGQIADLEQLFNLLSGAFKALRAHVDTFAIALDVKRKVFHENPSSVHPQTTIEEINLRLQDRSAIFVTRDNKIEGVIYASLLRNPTQWFVALRDFSNPHEIGIPRFMEVASILDHHKSEIKTHRVATIYAMDVQSSNVIGAKIAFEINKKLITDGPAEKELDQILQHSSMNTTDTRQLRIMERALEERIARAMNLGWCDSKRESSDYQMFLYAILDDTDLLAKKTAIDHEIVVELVNRLISLEQNKITEVIDPTSTKPLIQNPELYRFYKTVYGLKEADVEKRIQSLKIFNDTKKQSGALVSQLKIYPNNIRTLKQNYHQVSTAWNQHKTELPLKIMMVTTVEGAEDLFKGIKPAHHHQDELWLSAVESDEGRAQLGYFLMTFFALQVKKQIQALVPASSKLLFEEISMGKIPFKEHSDPWIVLQFEAGAITSRKKDISPCLKP